MSSYLPNFVNPRAWSSDSKMTFFPVSDYTGYDYTLNNAGSMGGTWGTTGTLPTLGYFGNGVYIENGQCLALPDNAELKLNNFTVELWFKRNGWGTSYARLIDKSYFDFEINRVASTDFVEFGCSLTWVSCPTTIANNTWYHMAVSRSGAIGSIWMNGYLVNTGSVGAAKFNSTNPLLLGKNTLDPSEYFNGIIDEVRVWNYARGSGDITANYNNAQFDCSQSGLIVCSKFDTNFRLFKNLATETVFTGQAALWFDQSKNNFQIKRISDENAISYIGMPSDFATGYFSPSATLSQSKDRITNVTAALDNTSTLVMGYQDNGDSNVGYTNKPYINIGYSGGAKLTGWRGWNPELFNNVQVNTPFKTPSQYTGTFFTGLVGCYYTDQLGSNLYVRYLNDNFFTEYLVNSGLSLGENQKFIYNLPTTKNPYNQFKKIILKKDKQGNIITYASKPTISFGFDNFDAYQTGNITILTGGYGLFFRENSFEFSNGYIISSGN
jgi:hypothetical protein